MARLADTISITLRSPSDAAGTLIGGRIEAPTAVVVDLAAVRAERARRQADEKREAQR